MTIKLTPEQRDFIANYIYTELALKTGPKSIGAYYFPLINTTFAIPTSSDYYVMLDHTNLKMKELDDSELKSAISGLSDDVYVEFCNNEFGADTSNFSAILSAKMKRFLGA